MNLQDIFASIEPLDEADMAEARERQAQLAKLPRQSRTAGGPVHPGGGHHGTASQPYGK